MRRDSWPRSGVLIIARRHSLPEVGNRRTEMDFCHSSSILMAGAPRRVKMWRRRRSRLRRNMNPFFLPRARWHLKGELPDGRQQGVQILSAKALRFAPVGLMLGEMGNFYPFLFARGMVFNYPQAQASQLAAAAATRARVSQRGIPTEKNG